MILGSGSRSARAATTPTRRCCGTPWPPSCGGEPPSLWAWELGARAELERLRLRAWAHILGFGGHWSTKSRRYSTTFTVLRRARVAFAKRRRTRDAIPLDAWGRAEDDQAVIVVASWAYVGSGYATEGERWLGLSRPPLVPANSDRLPGRNYAQPQHEQEHGR